MHPFSIYWCKIRTARLLYILYRNTGVPYSVRYIGRYTLGELKEHIAHIYRKRYYTFEIKESCEELLFSKMLDVYAERISSSVIYTYRLTKLGRRIARDLIEIAASEHAIAQKLTRMSSSPNVS